MYILLMYDISTKSKLGKKNLSKIHKTCKKYLVHIQNSVFEGEITKSNLKKLENELKFLINKEVDSVIVFKTREEKWLDKIFLGKEDDAMSNFL